jgi:glycosyltransferase involved in cell wall biosynthesis
MDMKIILLFQFVDPRGGAEIAAKTLTSEYRGALQLEVLDYDQFLAYDIRDNTLATSRIIIAQDVRVYLRIYFRRVLGLTSGMIGLHIHNDALSWRYHQGPSLVKSIKSFVQSCFAIALALASFHPVFCVSIRTYRYLRPFTTTKLIANPLRSVFLTRMRGEANGNDSQAKVRVLTIGSFRPVKGQLLGIACTRALVDRGVPIRWTMVGEGECLEICRREAEKLGVSAHVSFAGFDEDVHKYYLESDIYVCTSLSEGFSLSIAEALASGCKVVAGPKTNRFDSEWLGKRWYQSFDLRDPELLADKIMSLLTEAPPSDLDICQSIGGLTASKIIEVLMDGLP